MKIKKYKKYFLRFRLFGFAVFVVVLAFFIALFFFLPKSPKNVCSFIQSRQSEVCLDKELTKILETEGLEALIKFVKNEIVDKNAGYAVSHLIFHYIGEYAYDHTGSLDKTLSFIYPYIPQNSANNPLTIYMDGIDGFLHGSISRYFIEHKNESPKALISSVCDKKFDFKSKTWKVPDCFHTIGHAVMASNNNEVSKSITICESATYAYQINDCQYGVFMENGMLYSSDYHRGLPRPSVKGSSMVNLCNGYKDTQAINCSQIVGLSILINNSNDISLGFSECAKIVDNTPEKLRYRSCIKMSALWFITTYNKGDFKGMIETCKLLKFEFQGNCLNSVSKGLMLGEAGKRYKNFDFCSLVEEKLRSQCRE